MENRCSSHPVPSTTNKKSPDNRLRTFAAVHCPRLMCSADTTNAKERCNGGSSLSIGVSLFQTIVFSCHSFHKRELVGARPLHLANARPFRHLKAPLGLSLFRFAPQTRTCRGEAPPSCCRRTVRSLESPTGAFIVPLRSTNANCLLLRLRRNKQHDCHKNI